MVLTLRFSTFICGYRTQQGFKAVTFFDKQGDWEICLYPSAVTWVVIASPFNSTFTADIPYTQESVHPNTTEKTFNHNNKNIYTDSKLLCAIYISLAQG